MRQIKNVIEVLRSGGVIAHATETCYGFACDATQSRAIARLCALKKMAKNKPISIIVPDMETAERFGVFNYAARELAEKYWPGPLTIIVKRKKTLPKFLNPEENTIGFRVPGHELSLEIVKEFGGPITTTSANISGMPSTYSVAEISEQFAESDLKPDLIIDSGVLPINPPSTIVDCSGEKSNVIRQGELRI